MDIYHQRISAIYGFLRNGLEFDNDNDRLEFWRLRNNHIIQLIFYQSRKLSLRMAMDACRMFGGNSHTGALFNSNFFAVLVDGVVEEEQVAKVGGTAKQSFDDILGAVYISVVGKFDERKST